MQETRQPKDCQPNAVQHVKDAPQVVDPISTIQSAPSLEKFANNSSLHGINHIFHHGRFTARNFLWMIAFLGSLAFLMHAFVEQVELYFQYPHISALEEKTHHSVTFPAVTICNVNPLRFSQLSGHDLYWAGELLGFLDSSDRIVAPEKMDTEVLEILSQKLQRSKGERNLPFDFREFNDRAGHQIDQMLIQCKFGNESCSANDFKTLEKVFGAYALLLEREKKKL